MLRDGSMERGTGWRAGRGGGFRMLEMRGGWLTSSWWPGCGEEAVGFDAPGAEQHVVRCSPSPAAASSASTTITENVALECLGRGDRPISLCVLWGELVAVGEMQLLDVAAMCS